MSGSEAMASPFPAAEAATSCAESAVGHARRLRGGGSGGVTSVYPSERAVSGRWAGAVPSTRSPPTSRHARSRHRSRPHPCTGREAHRRARRASVDGNGERVGRAHDCAAVVDGAVAGLASAVATAKTPASVQSAIDLLDHVTHDWAGRRMNRARATPDHRKAVYGISAIPDRLRIRKDCRRRHTNDLETARCSLCACGVRHGALRKE